MTSRNTGDHSGLSRRSFLGLGALATAGSIAALSGCSPSGSASADNKEAVASSGAADWLGVEPEITDIASTEETELLIIGAGGAGTAAAATAVDLGLDFILCEKTNAVQETREYLGAVNSKYTKEAGVLVDEKKLLNELSRYASFKVDQEVIKVWIEQSGEMIDWIDPIMQAAGKPCVLDLPEEHATGGTDYYVPYLQHMYLDPYAPPMRNDVLQAYIEDKGHEIYFEHTMEKLVHTEGKVTGAIFSTADGYKQINAANVLLATGGYAGNATMIRTLQPLVTECVTASSFSMNCDGSGIKAGLWAGAKKELEGTAMIFDRGPVEPGTDAGYVSDAEDAPFPSTIFQANIGSQPFMKVNRHGKRFVNESTPYDFLCHAASFQDGGVWCMVFDGNAQQDIVRFNTLGCSAFAPMMMALGQPIDEFCAPELEAGYMVKADSLEELAEKLELPVEEFLAEVERYNEFYDKQQDEDYGKESYRLSAMKEPPFYGCWFGGSLLTTLDGLRINKNMQVLNEGGDVIEGLYAAGDVSGSFFSGNYPEYIVGCAIGRTVTFGRHAVRYIAGDLQA